MRRMILVALLCALSYAQTGGLNFDSLPTVEDLPPPDSLPPPDQVPFETMHSIAQNIITNLVGLKTNDNSAPPPPPMHPDTWDFPCTMYHRMGCEQHPKCRWFSSPEYAVCMFEDTPCQDVKVRGICQRSSMNCLWDPMAGMCYGQHTPCFFLREPTPCSRVGNCQWSNSAHVCWGEHSPCSTQKNSILCSVMESCDWNFHSMTCVKSTFVLGKPRGFPNKNDIWNKIPHNVKNQISDWTSDRQKSQKQIPMELQQTECGRITVPMQCIGSEECLWSDELNGCMPDTAPCHQIMALDACRVASEGKRCMWDPSESLCYGTDTPCEALNTKALCMMNTEGCNWIFNSICSAETEENYHPPAPKSSQRPPYQPTPYDYGGPAVPPPQGWSPYGPMHPEAEHPEGWSPYGPMHPEAEHPEGWSPYGPMHPEAEHPEGWSPYGPMRPEAELPERPAQPEAVGNGDGYIYPHISAQDIPQIFPSPFSPAQPYAEGEVYFDPNHKMVVPDSPNAGSGMAPNPGMGPRGNPGFDQTGRPGMEPRAQPPLDPNAPRPCASATTEALCDFGECEWYPNLGCVDEMGPCTNWNRQDACIMFEQCLWDPNAFPSGSCYDANAACDARRSEQVCGEDENCIWDRPSLGCYSQDPTQCMRMRDQRLCGLIADCYWINNACTDQQGVLLSSHDADSHFSALIVLMGISAGLILYLFLHSIISTKRKSDLLLEEPLP